MKHKFSVFNPFTIIGSIIMAPNYITYSWNICDPLSENPLFSHIPQIPQFQSLMIDNLGGTALDS